MGTFTAKSGAVWHVAEYSSAQTDTILIAAPGAGKAIQMLKWKFSSDTALKVTLKAGADVVDAQYVAANGGQIVPFEGAAAHAAWVSVPQLPANTALTVTTSAAGNVVVGVLYRIVDV